MTRAQRVIARAMINAWRTYGAAGYKAGYVDNAGHRPTPWGHGGNTAHAASALARARRHAATLTRQGVDVAAILTACL
jgi:hypothetical protein